MHLGHGRLAVLVLASLLLAACEPKPPSSTGPGKDGAAERPAGPCAGGAVKDDGTVETGYGFVPSATSGEYVQEFLPGELRSREMATVCVCWLKTRHGRDIDFEVVFYAAAGEVPAAEPYAVVQAAAAGLPESVAAAGGFVEVDVSAVTLEPGTAYVGARWDPSAARYLFVCADHSAETPQAPVFFREDRRPKWLAAADSPDPVFTNHRAILVRAEARR